MSDNVTRAAGSSAPSCSALCKHCGGEIAIRNTTGKCDHLYWPDMLTDEAKRANGFCLVTRQVWERMPNDKLSDGSPTKT